MSYTLYSNPRTGGYVAEAGLILAGQSYETIRVNHLTDGQKNSEFLKINPRGQVPALVLPDGTVMSESAAMAIHLAEAFPEAGLAPSLGSAGRAAFLRWITFLSVNIYEGNLRFYYADRYTADPAGVDGVKQAAMDYTERNLWLVEAALQDSAFLLGDTVSIADIYLAMVRLWYPRKTDFPRIDALSAAVRDHPPIADLWRRYFEDED